MAEMILGGLTIWYILTAGSLIFLIWDLLKNTPTGNVMKLAWVLVVIYTGPIGLFIYLLSCRQPLPNTHDAFIADRWKQAVGSLLHCVAGDATGIIISSAVVFHFGLPNGIDLIIEYIFAFLVGLFVFQALFMISMYEGNYWMAVRKTFFAEAISMNMIMAGMIPTMLILMQVIDGAHNPLHIEFWGVMSLATMVGMVTAYPINLWMVTKGIKHGMMSATPKHKGKETTSTTSEKMEANMDMSKGKQNMHHASKVSTLELFVILFSTFGLLALSLWITSLYAPITFVH